MEEIEVTVEQCDIDRGIPKSAYSCPIALAINRRHLQGASYVHVHPDPPPNKPREVLGHKFAGDHEHGFVVFVGVSNPTRKLPREASVFAADFDEGRPVKPFTFRLEALKP